MTVSDMELVRRYASEASEEAFQAIVSRHLNLVYSVALRRVRDPHLAQDVAQTVFIILARKARSLSDRTILSGWLCQTARYAAAKAITMRQRQLERETKAFLEPSPDEGESAQTWLRIEPLLDEAMDGLSRKDHDALVTRYLEGRSFREVSSALGTTEAGAKMRVNRALEKLRLIFAKRGITLSASLIAAAVSGHSVQAAPAALAASIAASAVQGAAATASTLTLLQTTLKYMAWTKLKTTTVIGAVALLTVGTATLVSHDSDDSSSPPSGVKSPSYVTPEATLQSLVAALQAANTEAFIAACTPQKAEEFRQRHAGKSADEMKAEAEGQGRAFAKTEIASRTVVSPTEIHLAIRGLGNSPNAPAGDRSVIARFKKIGNDWKFDGEVR